MLARFARKKEGDSFLLAETLAVEAAVELTIRCGWRKVSFISDPKTVIDAINNISMVCYEKYMFQFKKLERRPNSFNRKVQSS